MPMEDERARFEDEHSALRTIIRWIEADLARQLDSPQGLQADGPLLGPLRALRGQLSQHFDFEERSGVLPAALMLLKPGSMTVAGWKEQHCELLRQLDGLIVQLEEALRLGSVVAQSFADELRATFAAFGRHDAFENQLLGVRRTHRFRDEQEGFEAS